MLFQHTIDKVLSGEKTQTRRIVKPQTVPPRDGLPGNTDGEWMYNGKVFSAKPCAPGTGFWGLGYTPAKVKYFVGQTLAVQPGRGKAAVARMRITDIRREDVREISWEDTHAEGFVNKVQFFNTWLQMHDPTIYEVFRDYRFPYKGFKGATDLLESRPAERYQAWALTFELVR